MAQSSVITVRLAPEVKRKLEALARGTRRSKSFLAAEAIAAFVDVNAWQVTEIQTAIEEADADDFASAAEVEAAFEKWRR